MAAEIGLLIQAGSYIYRLSKAVQSVYKKAKKAKTPVGQGEIPVEPLFGNAFGTGDQLEGSQSREQQLCERGSMDSINECPKEMDLVAHPMTKMVVVAA